MNKNNPVLYFLFIISVLFACNTDTVYHAYHTLPSEGWNKRDTLFYPISLKDSLCSYEIAIALRNSTAYSYKNLYLFIHHNFPDSTSYITDTLECNIANDKGEWLGNGWGTLYQTTIPYKNVFLSHSGNYEIQISHGMKDTPLSGINDIGIQISKK